MYPKELYRNNHYAVVFSGEAEKELIAKGWSPDKDPDQEYVANTSGVPEDLPEPEVPRRGPGRPKKDPEPEKPAE